MQAPERKPPEKRKEEDQNEEVEVQGKSDSRRKKVRFEEDGEPDMSDNNRENDGDQQIHMGSREIMRDSEQMLELGSLLCTLDEDDQKIIRARVLGVDITEIYSPERIARVCREFQLVQGSSMDLQIGWDFSLASHRLAAVKKIKEEIPSLLIGSPPCPSYHTFPRDQKLLHS